MIRMLVQAVLSILILSGSAAPVQRPGAGPIGSGSESYTPSKCEWLAVELNSNYRVGNLKSGYTAQFFCRKPSTIFLSYKYLAETDKEAATLAADGIRDAISEVMKERSWKWVKVDDEIVKAEVPAEAPAAAVSKPRKGPSKPKKLPDGEYDEPGEVKEPAEGDEESTDETKPTDEEAADPESYHSPLKLKTSPNSNGISDDNTPQ